MNNETEFLQVIEKYCVNPVDYQYFHQLFHNRTVIFNQEVEESLIESVYLPLRDFENDLIEDPVTLILNSPGGSVSDGFFLAYYLKHYKKKLNIIVTGYAASMAAVILAGANHNENVTRCCYPSTYALIHDGYIAIAPAESKTAGDIMAFNDKVDNDIRKFILENTKITAEQYDAQARHQWFLSSNEMLEYGLVDKIIGGDA